MSTNLKRHITLWPLVLFGLGDILGAGVYGLIGKASAQMGNAVWLAFLMSMIAAGLTGLSYASLGSRYPRSGGASYVTHKAFNSPFLAYVVGLAVLASGLTSMATACRVFAGYFVGMIPVLPMNLVMILFALLLAGIIFYGIRETMWVNTLLTVIEVSGLAIIILIGFRYIGSVNYLDATTISNPTGEITIPIILTGAVLTFYSFVGFEDMLNVSEEVVNPQKNIPRGLILAVGLSSVIYMIISLIAVSVVPASELANSSQPLVDVVAKAAPWFPISVYSVIALFAVSNTALLNFVMGSRLLYGMSHQRLLPKFLSSVHAGRATPHRAIVLVLVILLVLIFSGDISTLARATSVLLLLCFTIVNISLIILKQKDKTPGFFEVPSFVPGLGALICILIVSQAKAQEMAIAGSILLVVVALYFFIRPKESDIEKMES